MSAPPQCCCLQCVLPNYPDSLTESTLPGNHMEDQGRVFLKNNLHEIHIKRTCDERFSDFVQHGPSRTIHEEVDMVRAFYYSKLPEDCIYIFRRPKPWPGPELLTQLKDSGVFLVPSAHIESTTHWDPRKHPRNNSSTKPLTNWRLSTNLMERLLVSDLTLPQMKVYIVMKMIRKEFCKLLVGDRFGTFHLKLRCCVA
ncbi:hypothetical protein DPMN_121331 [Dreissena polymorpha]|uniref:Uncharacterized protein n=1 Tax=Dreissena polymorpha TaxID=45954 RepID=A0A9D4JTG7_DREPO|nr:hypothetical protein DPMN_121331 [Dreissena polymorpha]